MRARKIANCSKTWGIVNRRRFRFPQYSHSSRVADRAYRRPRCDEAIPESLDEVSENRPPAAVCARPGRDATTATRDALSDTSKARRGPQQVWLSPKGISCIKDASPQAKCRSQPPQGAGDTRATHMRTTRSRIGVSHRGFGSGCANVPLTLNGANENPAVSSQGTGQSTITISTRRRIPCACRSRFPN